MLGSGRCDQQEGLPIKSFTSRFLSLNVKRLPGPFTLSRSPSLESWYGRAQYNPAPYS